MKDKMKRFLTSIGIENLDDFDMDFDLLSYDLFQPKKLNMMVVKQTPWTYELIRELQDHLVNITYQYSLRFSYINKPDRENVISLFKDWYQTIYRLPSEVEILFDDEEENGLIFVFSSDEEQDKYKYQLKDFKDFLYFLGYDFLIKSEVRYIEEIETPSISKKELRALEKSVEKEAKAIIKDSSEEGMGEGENEKGDVLAQIEEDHRKMNIEVGDAIMKTMLENKAEMERERERNRRNKRGGYVFVEKISDIVPEKGNVDFSGSIFLVEEKTFKDKTRLTIGVHDDAGGNIKVSMYETDQVSKEFIGGLKVKSNIRVKGCAYRDDYTKENMVKGHYLYMLPPDEIKADNAEKKRVELHLHSNMSTQDGITQMTDYIKYAKALGHTALAVTDHGVVQAFPDAQNAVMKDNDFKMIYGCEFYMVDGMKYVFNPCKIPLKKATYIVLDLETTGLSCRYDKIIEFSGYKVVEGLVESSIDILINPRRPIPKVITDLTTITDEMVVGKPTIKEALPQILAFIGDSVLVTHNATFDFSFLQEEIKNCGMEPLHNTVIDTLALSRYLFPESRNHRLGSLCKNMDIRYDEVSAHRADYDARVLNDVWQPIIEKLDTLGITNIDDLDKLETPKETLKHIRPTHCIALVKNQAGVRDLYELVSLSHTEYFAVSPKTPRREINRLRKNLLIGSACCNGEIFDISHTRSKEALKQAMEFYDYIEVQPPGNYSHLTYRNGSGRMSEEEILRSIKDIIEAADELGKPVVATGDVHYLTPKEKIFRDVYISAPAVGKGLHPLYPGKGRMADCPSPDQHFRTTEEMLECFSFLGEEKAYEIVVTNTNMIADQIERTIPAANDVLHTPDIPGCEDKLREICYKTAHDTFGENIPEEVKARLERELDGIISSGYAVIYYIAHILVKRTNDAGYIVGSRGSVGSSFVATMAGITEVNPLPPYYICPKCKHFEWGKESHPEIKSGYDLPDKVCPECGSKMKGEGQNIPFETFLGFNADKVPDIDLNFPRDFQAEAHKFTKDIVGEHNVYRAGTIETVKDKTAYGFARGYYEELAMGKVLKDPTSKGLTMKEVEGKAKDIVSKEATNAELSYIASGCIDVKRTTGQHPGGIVVLPQGHEIYEFTPIQYPADDLTNEWQTTHFDFSKIHDTLLKLDMLGHLDPMALKMMCDLTGIKVEDIPLNDRNVLSLFSSNKALKMERDYLGNRTGAMALPEFGTENTRRTLETTLPKTFTDLVVISGLSHGTGVWAGNAEDLIRNGIATLETVVGCRDDIMTSLIDKGLPSNIAFSIMETVRKKNKFLNEEQIALMRAKGVPDWYIDSCNKIEYLFPKGHACAYVIMAVRVAYFKLYYPLEFYATFFSVRSKQFDIFSMVKGEAAIIDTLDKLKLKSRTKGEKLSTKEEEILKTLQIAIEMCQRGYSFANISLDKSDGINFIVDHENKQLIPPFITLDGIGEAAANSVPEARKNGPFTSKEDLQRRTLLTQTNIKDLEELGVLEGMKEDERISLFDNFF